MSTDREFPLVSKVENEKGGMERHQLLICRATSKIKRDGHLAQRIGNKIWYLFILSYWLLSNSVVVSHWKLWYYHSMYVQWSLSKGLVFFAVQFFVVPGPAEVAPQGYSSRDTKLWVQRMKFPPKLNLNLPARWGDGAELPPHCWLCYTCFLAREELFSATDFQYLLLTDLLM